MRETSCLSECKAKINVKDEAVIGSLHDHTHAPDSARCEVLTVRDNITKRALETEEAPQQILGREMQSISQGTAVQMVPLRHICRQVRRDCKEVGAPPAIPTDRATVDLPDEHKTLASGENFVI